jgi:hypothetical protein
LSLDIAQLKLDLANDLIELQDYDATTAGAILERSLLEAAHWLALDKDWPWVLTQGQIAAISGTLNGYALPADFDGIPVESRLTKYYAYDAFGVDSLIKDGTYGRRYEVVVNYSSGTPVLNFEINPGTANLTLTYRKLLSVYADLAAWPDNIGMKVALKKYAAYLLVSNTPELQGAGANFLAMAEKQLDKLWKAFRRRSTRPDGRTPQNVWGRALYQDYAGDSL